MVAEQRPESSDLGKPSVIVPLHSALCNPLPPHPVRTSIQGYGSAMVSVSRDEFDRLNVALAEFKLSSTDEVRGLKEDVAKAGFDLRNEELARAAQSKEMLQEKFISRRRSSRIAVHQCPHGSPRARASTLN